MKMSQKHRAEKLNIKCDLCDNVGIIRNSLSKSTKHSSSCKYICDSGYLIHDNKGYSWICNDCFKFVKDLNKIKK